MEQTKKHFYAVISIITLFAIIIVVSFSGSSNEEVVQHDEKNQQKEKQEKQIVQSTQFDFEKDLNFNAEQLLLIRNDIALLRKELQNSTSKLNEEISVLKASAVEREKKINNQKAKGVKSFFGVSKDTYVDSPNTNKMGELKRYEEKDRLEDYDLNYNNRQGRRNKERNAVNSYDSRYNNRQDRRGEERNRQSFEEKEDKNYYEEDDYYREERYEQRGCEVERRRDNCNNQYYKDDYYQERRFKPQMRRYNDRY